jgi:TRAP-type uncharacterized transport system substrate-binding protein
MGKGLPRSMSRGVAARQAIVRQVIDLKGKTVAVTSAGSAVGFGTTVIGDLPQGNILFLGAVAYVQLSGSGADANLDATWDGDFSIGTAPTADVTLSGAEIDLIASTALGAATAEVSPRVRAVNATQSMLDNTDGAMEINLNVLIDAANIGDTQTVNLTVSGVVQLAYIVMLDD